MFLRWIPQLLAIVDTAKVCAISGIILNIAKTYPQSIMYAYRLSKENYCMGQNVVGKDTIDLIARYIFYCVKVRLWISP